MTQSSNLPDLEIDVTSERCPMTYVRTRLALDRLRPGQILAVSLRGAEAARNVPASALLQGHDVVETSTGTAGVTRLLLRRGSPKFLTPGQ